MNSNNGKADSDPQNPLTQATQAAPAEWETSGYLMIIGGADRLDPQATLARLFLRLVGQAESRSDLRDIVIITAATRHPEILRDEYVRIFTRLGVDPAHIHAPYIRNYDEAQAEETAYLMRNASGIFITGGDQYRLAQVLDRSAAEGAIMDAYGRGAVVAGTSAGATAMGRPMLVAGGGTGELRMGIVQMSHGLGWAGEDIIIDTHFGARGRFPRLASSVAEYPAALGVGIDENTCLLLRSDGHSTVVGTGVVYFVDGSRTEVNTAPGSTPGAAISIGPLQVDVLAAGGEYDLRERRILLETSRTARV